MPRQREPGEPKHDYSPDYQFNFLGEVLPQAKKVLLNYFAKTQHLRFSSIYKSIEIAAQIRQRLATVGIVCSEPYSNEERLIVAGSIYNLNRQFIDSHNHRGLIKIIEN